MSQPAEPAVLAHYHREGLAERILAAARQQGIHPLTPAALAPADHFHSYGLRATRDLATAAGLQPGQHVLDLGCGIGGPARTIAAEFGCRITGIDLSPEFIRTARILAEACGLAHQCEFHVADALQLPFPDAAFDAVITQHVAMNIADRPRFWSEARRVLSPGGTLALFDIIRGPNPEPLQYPVPWASDPAISHLLTEDETRALLETLRFAIQTWTVPPPPPLPQDPAGRPLSLRIVMGEDMLQRATNAGQALIDGRLALLLAVLRRPANPP